MEQARVTEETEKILQSSREITRRTMLGVASPSSDHKRSKSAPNLNKIPEKNYLTCGQHVNVFSLPMHNQ